MNNVDIKRAYRVLLPSVSSGFLAISVAALLAGFAFMTTVYVGSFESVQVQNIQAGELSSNRFIAWYQVTYDKIVLSNSLGAVSLFMFWSVVGLVSYLTVIGLISAFKEANDLKNQSDYVHIDRRKLYREELLRLVLRIIALLMLFVSLQFFMKSVLPWGRELARVGATEQLWFSQALYVASSLVVVAVGVHVLVVLVRLAMLRVRIFGDQLPVEDLR